MCPWVSFFLQMALQGLYLKCGAALRRVHILPPFAACSFEKSMYNEMCTRKTFKTSGTVCLIAGVHCWYVVLPVYGWVYTAVLQDFNLNIHDFTLSGKLHSLCNMLKHCVVADCFFPKTIDSESSLKLTSHTCCSVCVCCSRWCFVVLEKAMLLASHGY